MKLYLSVDMEGVGGIVDIAQTDEGHREYPRAQGWLMEEINAAVESAQTARPPTMIGMLRFDCMPMRLVNAFSCTASSGRSSGRRSYRKISPRTSTAWYQGSSA